MDTVTVACCYDIVSMIRVNHEVTGSDRIESIPSAYFLQGN